MNILLDYIFPITAIEPTPAASTGFLKQVLVLAKPKDGGVTPDVITAATTMTTVNTLVGVAAAAEIQQLFNAGMTRVRVMPTADLDVAAPLLGKENDQYTILVTSDFTDANVTAADFGAFQGVIGVASTDDAFLDVQSAIKNRSPFHTTSGTKAKNMFYAFGKLLSNPLNWLNQQYIPLPFADDVDTTGEALNLFDDRINFAIADGEFGNRLGFFVAGGEAVVAPYITKNLQIDLQSKALQYISGNQPGYTKTQAALLEDELQKVIDSYIAPPRQWIESGVVSVALLEDNFVASGNINISKPRALWRINGELRQTL